VDQEQYSLEYKAANKNGIGTLLKEHADFARFLAEHIRLEMQKKEMLVLIVINYTKITKQKHQLKDWSS